YAAVIEALKGSIVLLTGLALGAEELIVSRLLMEAAPQLKICLAVEPGIDVLWKYRRFGFHVIRVPLGLVCDAGSRQLAFAIMLHELANYFSIKIPEDLDRFIRSTRDSNLRPEIIAIGQASFNRVYGVDDPLTQECSF